MLLVGMLVIWSLSQSDISTKLNISWTYHLAISPLLIQPPTGMGESVPVITPLGGPTLETPPAPSRGMNQSTGIGPQGTLPGAEEQQSR